MDPRPILFKNSEKMCKNSGKMSRKCPSFVLLVALAGSGEQRFETKFSNWRKRPRIVSLVGSSDYSNMAVGCMFYVLLLVTQLLAFTREYAANKDVRRENHHKYTGYYKIKDSLCDID